MKLNQEKLQAIANMMSMHYWGIECTTTVFVNGRFGKKRGMFRVINQIQEPQQIEMIYIAKYVVDYDSNEKIISTLKHELCHWALWKQGQPYQDGHPNFESELVRIGSHSSGTQPGLGKRYEFKCISCGRTFLEKRKTLMNPNHRYVSSCCKAKFVFTREVILSRKDEVSAAEEEE